MELMVDLPGIYYKAFLEGNEQARAAALGAIQQQILEAQSECTHLTHSYDSAGFLFCTNCGFVIGRTYQIDDDWPVSNMEFWSVYDARAYGENQGKSFKQQQEAEIMELDI